MAWDTPSVNRGRRAQAPAPAAAPVRNVAFGEILRRLVLAALAGLVLGWVASWAVPVAGATTLRLVELGAAALGAALALRLQWAPRRHGLPQRVLDGADRRWIGGRQYDTPVSGYGVGEGLVEVAIDVVVDIATD